MAIDRAEARALLEDVQGIEDRVRQLMTYARVSDYLLLWGAIWLVGFSVNYFARPFSNTLWLFLQGLGLAATVTIVALRSLGHGRPDLFVPLRAGLSVLAIIGFGTLWSNLAHLGWREEVTFWPTFLCFLLFLFGLWAGRALAVAAATIFAVTLAGYFFAGNFLHLWVALSCGGGMIAGGLWLRRGG